MIPRPRMLRALAVAMVMLSGCTGRTVPESDRARAPSASFTSFVNRVWRVERSSTVEPGTLYTFLSEGTLVIASPHGRPALGTWSRQGDELIMVEESLRYPVEILAATADSFSIRMRNPGEPVLITFVPAERPDSLR